MTNPNDDLAERVTALERDVCEIRADAAAARVLAGAADRDVSEFKQILQGHTRTLNALRETQVEQGDRLTGLEREMHGMKREMREGFSTLNVGMAQITKASHCTPTTPTTHTFSGIDLTRFGIGTARVISAATPERSTST